MAKKELKQMDEAKLLELVNEKRNELADAKFKASLGEIKDFSSLGKIKKEVARAMTALNQKRREA